MREREREGKREKEKLGEELRETLRGKLRKIFREKSSETPRETLYKSSTKALNSFAISANLHVAHILLIPFASHRLLTTICRLIGSSRIGSLHPNFSFEVFIRSSR